MKNIEVALLNYKFTFRQLHWREEFNIRFSPKKDRLRTILSNALIEVSGFPVNSSADAMKILEAVPSTVIYRVFVIYKGSVPPPRKFQTMGLYKAPEPNRFVRQMQEQEEKQEEVLDRVKYDMENRFGSKEMEEQRELERRMLQNSGGRGLTPASSEDGTAPAAVKPRPDTGLGTRPPNKLTPPRTRPQGPIKTKTLGKKHV